MTSGPPLERQKRSARADEPRGRPAPPPRPRGVDPAGGPVSTQRTSAASPSEHPAKIVGIPRFLFGVQRLNGVDVSTMDTRTCQAAFIGSPSSSGRAAPPWGPARASDSEVMTLTCLRSEETRQRDECTPRSSGARALRTTPGQLHPRPRAVHPVDTWSSRSGSEQDPATRRDHAGWTCPVSNVIKGMQTLTRPQSRVFDPASLHGRAAPGAAGTTVSRPSPRSPAPVTCRESTIRPPQESL